ncbi:MAG: NADPH-dependent F420 reductase [Anaerolineae bacterium]|nr:NADPH-dependent F420 reductase [Thermoflexales bacterium]MDW8406576.1 NADPH-dependent F420 reductase [Anaerolineae bacterium]
MQIAIVGGTGKEGSGLALRWANAGHEIIIGSRDAEKAARVAEELNLALGNGAARVRGATNLDAAQAGEVVVLTVPYSAHADTLRSVQPALSGKVLIDVTVPVNPADITRVSVPAGGSATVEAQRLLGPDVKVVAAFQNISFTHLKKLDTAIDCDVLVCGDDAQAKQIALQLVQDAGMRGFDAGPADNAIVVEGLTSVLLAINKRHKIKGAGIRITGV